MRNMLSGLWIWIVRAFAGVLVLFAILDLAYAHHWQNAAIEVVVAALLIWFGAWLNRRREDRRERLRPSSHHPRTPLPPR